MVRYTTEQKEQALAMMAEQGATKTSKALGIAQPTLFAWRKAAAEKDGQAPVSKPKKRNVKPKATKNEEAIPQQAASTDDIHALLAEDEKLSQKLQEQEMEIIRLREQNAKLKKLILSLIEE